jgi:hypothetical protein
MFKYFNPVWIIKNFLQPSLGPEILVPAAIGAVGSGVIGGNPIKGALLGAATGGILGGAGGAGGTGGLFSGFKGVAPEAVSLGSGGYAQLAQNPLGAIGGAAKGGINFGANGINSTLGGTNLPLGSQGIQIDKFNPAINFTDDGLAFADKGLSSADQMFTNKFVTEQNPFAVDARRMAVDTPLTFGERLSDLGSNTMSYAQQNPMTVLSGGQSLLDIRQQNEQADKQRLQEAVAMGNQQIRKGQSGPMAGNLLQVKRIG